MPERDANLLLNTKLFIPQMRRGAVQRPQIVSLLNAGLTYPLVLVSAAAGSGKTTALVEWADQLQCPVAWLSLDEGDNDPRHFVTYLLAALQTAVPGTGVDTALAIRSAGSPNLEDLVAGLINDVAALPHPLVLILDDYHLIRTPDIHRTVSFLIERMPPHSHLVVATRTDPQLPLARLRARMQMLELRDGDLRFSIDEARAFLNVTMGLAISGDDVRALEARTEGWIVGLQLAALCLAKQTDVSGFVANFGGSHRHVFDYLTEEVLRHQPRDVLTFLIKTSLLDRFCAPVCRALYGSDPDAPDCPAMLRHLEDGNLFIVPLDEERTWYRYHHLFSDLLRRKARAQGAQQLTELHRRAGEWYAERATMNGDAGAAAEAVRHTMAGGDEGQAVAMVERLGMVLLQQGQEAVLRSWLASLPQTAVDGRPWLLVFNAWTSLLLGQLHAVEPILEAAQAALSGTRSQTDTPALRAHLEVLRAYSLATRAYARGALEDMPRIISIAERAAGLSWGEDLQLRCIADYALAVAHTLNGDARTACTHYLRAANEALTSGNLNLAVGAEYMAGTQYTVMGELRHAAEVHQRTLARLTAQGGRQSPLAALADAGLAEVLYEWNQLDAAEAAARQGAALGLRLGRTGARVRNASALGRILLALGDWVGADEIIREAETTCWGQDLDPEAAASLRASRTMLWLSPLRQDLHALGRWLAESGAGDGRCMQYAREPEVLALARAHVAVGSGDTAAVHLETARHLLNGFCQSCQDKGRTGRLVAGLALCAVVDRALGDPRKAMETLREALDLGEPQGYLRSFVDAGPQIAALLSEMIRTRFLPPTPYVGAILAAFGVEVRAAAPPERAGPGPSPADPVPLVIAADVLTEREHQVLQAMAAGLSNAEIAARLVITVSTVKRHVNHIFAKLGATSRVQALLRARELGLL